MVAPHRMLALTFNVNANIDFLKFPGIVKGFHRVAATRGEIRGGEAGPLTVRPRRGRGKL